MKFQIGHEFAFKSSRLKGRGCGAGAPNFNAIPEVAYELQWFEKFKVEHTRTQTQAKRHIFLDVLDYSE